MGVMGMGISWLFWVALAVIVIIVIGRIYRKGKNGWGPKDNALEILRQRYAKGEIGKAEFEQKKKELEK